jgi:hypothetical protein
MKRLFPTLVILSLFTVFSSFTTKQDVSPAVLDAFANTFKHVSEVSWSSTGDYYRVDFVLNNQYVTAFYNLEGKQIAITKNIRSEELPLLLQAELSEYRNSFWITNLFEYTDDNGTSYFVTLENAERKLTLKSTAGANWEVYKKQRKA